MKQDIGKILAFGGAFASLLDLYGLITTGNQLAFWIIMAAALVMVTVGIWLAWD